MLQAAVKALFRPSYGRNSLADTTERKGQGLWLRADKGCSSLEDRRGSAPVGSAVAWMLVAMVGCQCRGGCTFCVPQAGCSFVVSTFFFLKGVSSAVQRLKLRY